MNAIALPLKKVPKFVEYLEKKITILPPDLLIYEKWDEATDVHFSNDLFTHLGFVAFVGRPTRTPACVRFAQRYALFSDQGMALCPCRWFSSFEFRNNMNFGKKYSHMRGSKEKCYTKRQRYTYVS